MKFSPTMIVILGLIALVVIARIIIPSPEQQMLNQYNEQNQQMLNYYNEQNQQMQMQNMQMLNSMQSQMVDPYQSGYNTPGYYQQAPGYQGNGYAYPNNGGYAYPNGNGYPQQPQSNGYTNTDDNWNW